MFESIPTREIQFSYLDDLVVTVRPACVDLNPLYVAAASYWVAPLKLASQLPDDHPRKLSDERALIALAKVYGMAVMAGSSDERLAAFTPDQWEAWLLENQPEFQSIRDVCEVRTNFVDQDDVAGAAERIAGLVADEFGAAVGT